MKNNRKILCICMVFALCIAALSCGKKPEKTGAEGGGEFSFSTIIDENGLWKGIKALDYVELFNYKAMPIPSDTHRISDAALQSEIDALLADYSAPVRVTDRAVEEGDKVNIDYVGSVDGVEFQGGSTGGSGTEVTAGSTEYIDDFLFQIIGHMPGETIDVEVTFPENYGKEELNGKDALFVTTINYIIAEYDYPELTDEFVVQNFSSDHGWNSVDELMEGMRSNLQKNAIQKYIREYIGNSVTLKPVPDELVEYQNDAMLDYYQNIATGYYNMELEEFLNSIVGVSGVDELISQNYESNLIEAKYGLVLQAIAEDYGFSVGDEDVKNYFVTYMGTDDYSNYEVQYGLPYLKQFVLYQKILDYITENAILT